MESQNSNEEFVAQLTTHQNRLYVYIASLLCDSDRAKDVLQQTNIVLWRKASEFERGTSFAAWACKVAYFQVLNERRKMKRERLVFDDDILECFSSEAIDQLSCADERAEALGECLESLPAGQRRQIVERYSTGGTVKSVAKSSGRTAGAVATSLYRIRSALLDCVQRKLANSAGV